VTLKPEIVERIEAKCVRAGVSTSRMAETLIEEGLRSLRRRETPWEARLGVTASQVAALCRALGVRRLALFGSALTDQFGGESDIDLLVEFGPGVVKTLLDRGRAQMEFEALFGRKVDLADLRLIDNPIRKNEIMGRQQEIYAA
jgi:predicted nucleotidyltransferase